MIQKIVGKNIRYYRIQKGFSQKKAASLVGITSSYWGYLERGQKNPSIELVAMISKVLGVKAYLLFIESPAESLPEEIVHYLHLLNCMEDKHIDFILTVIKAYINLQKIQK
ncbi:DNA-binding transcriptional regulator, XRE-family HTH domain [Desulfotomaculum arcticum]|uniref:DNA-binding transcriptional regulator, XRE-family HTH domain n=1 Tax=Desulfotruncus arcticus DSM 17038 TaxID=1121424 RepID=A0A1I2TGW3_9FIRM|nr:helix-turn-helix transcriptional regulator [Desulfotruncus arcticus]SFG64093.1 DNA-binding transcriptional regulator, XRE-family HTH domain [Desulfotomaculum arcticum] [Desulfotruncus arcticus DSM 17038]